MDINLKEMSDISDNEDDQQLKNNNKSKYVNPFPQD